MGTIFLDITDFHLTITTLSTWPNRILRDLGSASMAAEISTDPLQEEIINIWGVKSINTDVVIDNRI